MVERTMRELIVHLTRVYPKQPISGGTIDAYIEQLADVPPPDLAAAADLHIRTSQWFPSVAELRATDAELRLRLPTEADALRQIEARIAWGREAEETRPDDPPPVHPLVAEALTRVGGYPAFRQADDPVMLRGQFGRLYREERDRALRAAQAGR